MKRECNNPTLQAKGSFKFVFKNLQVIWEEFKWWQIPWVSKDKGICTPLSGEKNIYKKIIISRENTGWRPAQLSALLPVLLRYRMPFISAALLSAWQKAHILFQHTSNRATPLSYRVQFSQEMSDGASLWRAALRPFKVRSLLQDNRGP